MFKQKKSKLNSLTKIFSFGTFVLFFFLSQIIHSESVYACPTISTLEWLEPKMSDSTISCSVNPDNTINISGSIRIGEMYDYTYPGSCDDVTYPFLKYSNPDITMPNSLVLSSSDAGISLQTTSYTNQNSSYYEFNYTNIDVGTFYDAFTLTMTGNATIGVGEPLITHTVVDQTVVCNVPARTPLDVTPPVCGAVTYSETLNANNIITYTGSKPSVTATVGCSDPGSPSSGCANATESLVVNSSGNYNITISDQASPTPNTTDCPFEIHYNEEPTISTSFSSCTLDTTFNDPDELSGQSSNIKIYADTRTTYANNPPDPRKWWRYWSDGPTTNRTFSFNIDNNDEYNLGDTVYVHSKFEDHADDGQVVVNDDGFVFLDGPYNFAACSPNDMPTCTLTASPPTSPPTFAQNETVTFDYTSNDTDGTIESGVLNFGNTNTFNLPAASPSVLPDGSYQYVYYQVGTFTPTLTVTDDLGGEGTCSVSAGVTVTNILPTCSFTANPTSLLVNEDVTFTYSAADSDGSVANVDIYYDDGASNSVPAGSGMTNTHTYLEANTFTPQIVVEDDNGATVTCSDNVTVSTDNTPPTITADPNFACTNVPQNIDVSVEDNAGGVGVDSTSVRYIWAGNSSYTYPFPGAQQNPAPMSMGFTTVTDSNELRVLASDVAGNSADETFPYNYDKWGPTFSASPSPSAAWNSSNLTISLSASNAGCGGGGHYDYSTNNITWTAFSGTSASVTLNTDGSHSIQTRGWDGLNNYSSDNFYPYKVDTQAPTVSPVHTQVSPPTAVNINESTDNSQTVTITATDVLKDNSRSGISRITYNAGSNFTAYWSAELSPAGGYTRQTCGGGGYLYVLNTASDYVDVTNCSTGGNVNARIITISFDILDTIPVNDNEFDYQVFATDNAGNNSATSAGFFAINKSPVLGIISPDDNAIVNSGEDVIFSASFNDPESNPLVSTSATPHWIVNCVGAGTTPIIPPTNPATVTITEDMAPNQCTYQFCAADEGLDDDGFEACSPLRSMRINVSPTIEDITYSPNDAALTHFGSGYGDNDAYEFSVRVKDKDGIADLKTVRFSINSSAGDDGDDQNAIFQLNMTNNQFNQLDKNDSGVPVWKLLCDINACNDNDTATSITSYNGEWELTDAYYVEEAVTLPTYLDVILRMRFNPEIWNEQVDAFAYAGDLNSANTNNSDGTWVSYEALNGFGSFPDIDTLAPSYISASFSETSTPDCAYARSENNTGYVRDFCGINLKLRVEERGLNQDIGLMGVILQKASLDESYEYSYNLRTSVGHPGTMDPDDPDYPSIDFPDIVSSEVVGTSPTIVEGTFQINGGSSDDNESYNAFIKAEDATGLGNDAFPGNTMTF